MEDETPSYLTVGLAVNGSKKTKYVVKWALDKFVPEGVLLFKLFFVRPKITTVPTPMGSLPISQAREDVAIAYRKEIEWQTQEKLTRFTNMCASRKVEVEIVQIESDDVVDAIKHETVKNNISTLVIGASSKGAFSRRPNLALKICESAPNFCTVYVISKDGLSSVRASYSENTGNSKDGSNSSFSSTITSSSSRALSSRTEMSLLDAISCKTFSKIELVRHAFEPNEKKSVFEPGPTRPTTKAKTRTTPLRNSTPATGLVTSEGILSKRAREDTKDTSEEQALVRRQRRENSSEKSPSKSDETVIDLLARHLDGEYSPQGMDIAVAAHPDMSSLAESDYSDDDVDHVTPEILEKIEQVATEVMALRANDKCWDMRKVIMSLEETQMGQAAAFAQVKVAEIVCGEAKEKLAKTKETLMESMEQLMQAQKKLYQLQLNQLKSDQAKQFELKTDLEAECIRLHEGNIATRSQVALMKENLDLTAKQHLDNVADHASQIAELKGVINVLTEEKNWLLTKGFNQFSKKILSSAEMIKAVAKVNTAANRVGYNEGIKAGYQYALEASIPIHEVPDLEANAHDHLVEAAEEFEHTSFPCVSELAEMVGAPFEQIKSFIQDP